MFTPRYNSACTGAKSFRRARRTLLRITAALLASALVPVFAAAQQSPPDWQTQVRKYCDASDWPSALNVLDKEIARSPQDLNLKAWRARVLFWSGALAQAREEYQELLRVSPTDPDNWLALANVLARESKTQDALEALDRAIQLDPKRPDLRIARARVLRESGKRSESRTEFEQALRLDPASSEARSGLHSLRAEPRSELRIGNETDFLSYTAANQGNFANLATRWSPQWASSLGVAEYYRGGFFAEKFIASATARSHRFGALTIGGTVANDNAVIPKNEAFFDLDRGWKLSESRTLRGLELDYGQHWYWYQAARILALNGAAILYLPRDWSFALAATGARSAFSGTGAEWRPSGSGKLSFPLATGKAAQLSGNIFFAAGSENFALSDQIGRFASQTYGGGLRLRFAERQDITCAASYQRRTQGRTDTYLGFSYGIHF